MTEMEQARTHLRECQQRLSSARQALTLWDMPHRALEDMVFAALSWVWDAQEREIASQPRLAVGMTITGSDGYRGKIVSLNQG